MTPRRVAGVWALTAGTAAAAATLHWMVVPPDRPGVEAWPWVWPLFVLAGFALCELFLVHLRWGRDAVSFSVMEIPLVLGLYFVRPDLLVACRLGGALLAFLWQRKPFQKAAFNCALYALETTTAVVIWNLVVGDRTEYGPWGWLATLLAVAATALIGSTMVSLVITAATGERPRSVSDVFSLGQLGDLANGCVALIAAYIIVTDWRASWLLLVFAAVLVVAYRSYDGARQRSESLEQVNRFTELVGAEVELESVISTVLREVRAAFDVRTVELRLDGVDGAVEDWALRDGIAAGGPTPLIEALQASTELGAARLVPRRGAPTELTALLARHGARDCLMVPLRSEGRAVGSMLVADMLGDVDTFEPADLSQLRALGNHAAVAIDNAVRAHQIVREAEDRERRAMHDELTGLPNRRLFTRRLDEQLARGTASILLLDLDRFKDVNDTLGHELGDRLLCHVAERLSQAVAGDALVARFGGDEFAVMVPDGGDSELGACAAVVRGALARPFHLAGVAVAVEASVGGAVAADGTDGVTLLRWVDMAMYEAKGRRSGFEVFRPELDHRDSSRLGLLADLREAVAGDLLEVHYQPKVDLRTGRVEGVEALARWHHAEHGPIGPDEFIPLAEHSSLVTPLTMIVLRTALRDAERWLALVPGFTVAVNISPRSLLDPAFVDEVARCLAVVAVPASSLTLEITETSLMSDPERAIAALHRLRDLGVKLSVDDLGTGYSSLAYLQRLPVDEVKIDRSFVSAFPDPGAKAVVGAVIELGHRLGRRVVAEGVETAQTMTDLRALCCDTAQGYWIARPADEPTTTRWLERWTSRTHGTLYIVGSGEPAARIGDS